MGKVRPNKIVVIVEDQVPDANGHAGIAMEMFPRFYRRPMTAADYLAIEVAEAVEQFVERHGEQLGNPVVKAMGNDGEVLDIAAFKRDHPACLYEAANDLYVACQKARKIFAMYVELHRVKGTEEGDRKARENEKLVEMMDAAIAKARGEG